MENILFCSAIIVGSAALFKIAEAVKYFIMYKDDIKPTITKWVPFLSISALLFSYPNIWSVCFILFACILFALGKMFLLTHSLTK